MLHLNSNCSSPTPRENKNNLPQLESKTCFREKLKVARNFSSADSSGFTFACVNAANAANVIKDLLRKVVAAQSYGHMFSSGSHFALADLALPKAENNHFSLSALAHLEKISAQNLTAVTGRVGELNPDEERLQKNILASEWCFRHQSNADLEDADVLKISSNHVLERNAISHHSHTESEDKVALGNDDFVFWGVEFSGGYKPGYVPLNKTQSTSDFGGNAYIANENNPSCRAGYLTLTDQFYNRVPPPHRNGHKSFSERFPVASRKVYREIFEVNNEAKIAPIFSFQDMKKAVALHLIAFLRNSQDADLCNFAFNEVRSSGKDLDLLLNSIFQAEFHTPRMLCTTEYSMHSLRPIALEEAVSASNFSALTKTITNKELALEAMFHAIRKSKNDVVSYLFKRWEFNAKDFSPDGAKRYYGYEWAYILSDAGSCPLILAQFLERKLVDPNVTFKHTIGGETMMDNVIRYLDFPRYKEGCQKAFDLLLKHGARRPGVETAS